MVFFIRSMFTEGHYANGIQVKFLSRQVALFTIFYTLLLDNFLLTALVPIIPDFLLEKDKEQLEDTLRKNNLTIFDNKTTLQILRQPTNDSDATGNVSHSPDGAGFSMVKEIFSFPLHTINENTRVGWLLSSKAIVQIGANVIIGLLTNRIGYAVPVFIGSLILLISTGVFIIGETYTPLLIARSLQGIGSACANIAGMGIVAEIYPDDKERSKAMGIALGGSAAGVLVGYPLGGFMYSYLGKFAPFLFIFALTLVDIILQMFFLRSTAEEILPVPQQSIWQLIRDPYILITCGAIMFTTMAMSSLEPTIPIWMMQTMQVKKWQVGLVFLPDSIGYLIGTNCFGVAARNIGRWICGLGCMVLIGFCCVCVPLATTISQLILPHFGLGLALGITDAALMPMLALLVDKRHNGVYGGVYSISQLAVCLAYALGPSIAGHVVKSFGFVTLMRTVAALNIAYAPLCWFLRDVSSQTAETNVILPTNQKTWGKYTDGETTHFKYQRFDNE